MSVQASESDPARIAAPRIRAAIVIGLALVFVVPALHMSGQLTRLDARQDVQGAAGQIEAGGSGLVTGVRAVLDWIDGNRLEVALAPGASALVVWCTLILPTGIDPQLVSINDAPYDPPPADGTC